MPIYTGAAFFDVADHRKMMDYIDHNGGHENTFICSDTGFCTCSVPRREMDVDVAPNRHTLTYFTDAAKRYWHEYYGPTIHVSGSFTSNITFEPWEWRLNDGYVAEMNVFQVHAIRDKDGKQICGKLPVQKSYRLGAYREPEIDVSSNGELISYAIIKPYGADNWNGNGPYSGASNSSYPNLVWCPHPSLFVQKLADGYLVGFHGFKTYHVDMDQNITEIGDDTKNLRFNFLKKIYEAKA